MVTVAYRRPAAAKAPTVSFVLLDWDCRESFHSLDYLAEQTVDRDEYEIIWIEFYQRRAAELDKKLADYSARGRPAPIDIWTIIGMDRKLYYHKHLMYNIGVVQSRGDIVVICDSDAMFPPDFVETVITTFRENPNSVVHFDEVRNAREEFYPFNYPSFEEVLGPGVINWRDGKTNGLWDTADPLHTRNYGACFCARRTDLIAIGGADEHLDYLGHVCGPYELTFRLVNKGLREIWHDQVFLYHTWHPGSDGDFNYIGPHDGRHMSATALAVRENGRVMPLVENASIRGLREGRGLDLSVLIDPSYCEAWTEEAVARSPRFQLFKQNKAAPRLIMSLDQHNIVAYDGQYYGAPRELGPVDLEQESARQDPGIIRDANLETLKAAIEALSAEYPAALPASGERPAITPNGAAASSVDRQLMVTAGPVPGLTASSEPTANGTGSIADFITRTISQSQLKRDILNQRLDRIEAEYERRNQLLKQVQAASVQKDRLIATLQNRIVEIEREREEVVREARHWRDHVLQFRTELELLPLLHRKEIAMDTGSGVLVLPTSEPGHFLFGPYLPLQEGGYTLAVKFRAAWVLRAKDPVLTIEIATADRILASEVLSADAKDLVKIAFTVPSEADVETTKIEFRLSHHANASLEVSELRLGAMHPEAPRKNRLSSPTVFWRASALRLLHRPA
jgi:hypothetical protein